MKLNRLMFLMVAILVAASVAQAEPPAAADTANRMLRWWSGFGLPGRC